MPTIKDVMSSARRKLIASPHFSPLINVDVGADEPGSAFDDGWVFLGDGDSIAPYRHPANTGFASVSFNMRDPWREHNDYNTLDFRQLKFSILADLTRVEGKTNLTGTADAEFRCDRIATAIKDTFNDVGNADHHWPNNVYIISCLLYMDLYIDDVPKKDGLVEGTLSFKLEIG